jgi:hypothetical protein
MLHLPTSLSAVHHESIPTVKFNAVFDFPGCLDDFVDLAIFTMQSKKDAMNVNNFAWSLYCPQFHDLATAFVGSRFTKNFQLLMATASRTQTPIIGGAARSFGFRHRRLAFHSAGRSIFACLDEMLSPQSLTSASKQKLKVLLLVTLGILVAVQHCTRRRMQVESSTEVSISLGRELNKHICRMLTYHAVLIASDI